MESDPKHLFDLRIDKNPHYPSHIINRIELIEGDSNSFLCCVTMSAFLCVFSLNTISALSAPLLIANVFKDSIDNSCWSICGFVRDSSLDIAVGSNARKVCLYRIRMDPNISGELTGEYCRIWEVVHGNNVPSIAFSSDGRYIASACIDAHLRVLTADSGCVVGLSSPATAVALPAEGRDEFSLACWAVAFIDTKYIKQHGLVHLDGHLVLLSTRNCVFICDTTCHVLSCLHFAVPSRFLMGNPMIDRISFLEAAPELSAFLCASSDAINPCLGRLVYENNTISAVSHKINLECTEDSGRIVGLRLKRLETALKATQIFYILVLYESSTIDCFSLNPSNFLEGVANLIF